MVVEVVITVMAGADARADGPGAAEAQVARGAAVLTRGKLWPGHEAVGRRC